MSESVLLGDLCTKITKGTTPSAKDGGFSETGINYIKSESLAYDGAIDRSKFVFISAETHQRLRRSVIQEDDILYSIAGANLGKCGLASQKHLPANTNQAVAIIRVDQKRASPRFISFVLRDPGFVRSVLGGVAQSAQPNVNLAEIRRFRVPNLPLPEQLAIAAILGTLDDKIDLNRRMNETLEAMARALFKDWFVDFGPTRAKMEGREPYLAPDVWALFPDRLDDERKPEGWAFDIVKGVAVLNPESWTATNAPEGVRYVDLSNTKWGHIEKIELFKWDDAPSRARRILKPGDTIIGTVRPGNGSFAYIGDDGLTGSTGFAVLRPINARDRAFVWCATTSPENIDRLSRLADGAAYPAVRPEVVESTAVVLPNDHVFRAFSGVTSPLLGRIHANRTEARALAQTRDLLLPKLMSGEIRVRDAQRMVEEVV